MISWDKDHGLKLKLLCHGICHRHGLDKEARDICLDTTIAMNDGTWKMFWINHLYMEL